MAASTSDLGACAKDIIGQTASLSLTLNSTESQCRSPSSQPRLPLRFIRACIRLMDKRNVIEIYAFDRSKVLGAQP